MRQEFIIEGRLSSMNDLIRACRTNPHVGAKMKRDNEELVAWGIAAARLKPMRSPVTVSVEWRERNSRRDPDNVRAGIKFVLDALVKAHVLAGDSQAHIAGLSDTFTVDKDDPRVIVRMEEA
jgi:Holliday junction resolvase RusA-like endonuclease